MVYLKSILVGLAAAFVVTVLTILAGVMLMEDAVSRVSSTGSGGLGAVSAPLFGFPYLSLVGFGLGFWWQFRRGRRRQIGR